MANVIGVVILILFVSGLLIGLTLATYFLFLSPGQKAEKQNKKTRKELDKVMRKNMPKK